MKCPRRHVLQLPILFAGITIIPGEMDLQILIFKAYDIVIGIKAHIKFFADDASLFLVVEDFPSVSNILNVEM